MTSLPRCQSCGVATGPCQLRERGVLSLEDSRTVTHKGSRYVCIYIYAYIYMYIYIYIMMFAISIHSSIGACGKWQVGYRLSAEVGCLALRVSNASMGRPTNLKTRGSTPTNSLRRAWCAKARALTGRVHIGFVLTSPPYRNEVIHNPGLFFLCAP